MSIRNTEISKDPAPGSSEKAGWRVKEWSSAVGCSVSRTHELIKDKQIESCKFGATRLIKTPPAIFVAALPSE